MTVERESRPDTASEAAPKTTTTKQQVWFHSSGSLRHGAAKRLMPKGRCGCIRDPLVDVHLCGGEISDVMADAAVQAAKHLAAHGVPGLFGQNMCRAMWRRGHHRLAAECFSYSSGEAA